MIEPDVAQKLDALKQQIDAIYVSVERTRTYFLWTLIVTLVLFVLPLVGLVFALPAFLGSYTETISSFNGY